MRSGAQTPSCDVAFVGGGFRTTTFLASVPELLEHDVAVLEERDGLGAGAFDDYSTPSSSYGARFFRHVRREGLFASILAAPEVDTIASAEHPVDLLALARALALLGRSLEDALGPERALVGTRVVEIRASKGDMPFTIRTAGGTDVRASSCVLATGRREQLAPELEPWREKVWLSSAVISASRRPRLAEALRDASGRSVVVLGGSHSAFSALGVLLREIEVLAATDAGFRPPRILIAHRSIPRLYYDSVEDARRDQVPGRELPFDESQHVCPATGIVFRDSGLRHEAKELYCAAWNGLLPNVHLVRSPSLAACEDAIADAALVVQALGYQGQAPALTVDGVSVWDGVRPPQVTADDDGRVILPGGLAQGLDLYALRVEPTPRARRDSTNYAADLYSRLGSALLDGLARRSAFDRADLALTSDAR